MLFTPQDVQLVCGLFPVAPRVTHRFFLTDARVGSLDRRAVALVGPMLGAPQAVMVLEKMIALGVSDVVAVGWCGSIHPKVRIGHVVLPTGAVSEEGTSGHYSVDPGLARPSEEMLHRLREVFASQGLTLHEGSVWSTDAPYRETRGKVSAFQRAGVLGVDMESSALLTVARYRSIRLALVLVVSDELFSLEWIHGFKDPRFQDARRIVVERTLQAAFSMVTESGMIRGQRPV
jgi:uridine phosphorylase